MPRPMAKIGRERLDEALLMIDQQCDGAIETVDARRCIDFAALQVVGALAAEQLQHRRAAGFLHGHPPI